MARCAAREPHGADGDGARGLGFVRLVLRHQAPAGYLFGMERLAVCHAMQGHTHLVECLTMTTEQLPEFTAKMSEWLPSPRSDETRRLTPEEVVVKAHRSLAGYADAEHASGANNAATSTTTKTTSVAPSSSTSS